MQVSEIAATQHLNSSARCIKPLPELTSVGTVVDGECQTRICSRCFLSDVTEK